MSVVSFCECSQLEKVEFSAKLNTIGDFAFEYCTNLKEITYDGFLSRWNEIDKGFSWAYDAQTKHVACFDAWAYID